MKICHVERKPLLKVLQLMEATGTKIFYFESGTISAGDDCHLFVTAKTGINYMTGGFYKDDFQGFRDCVEFIQNDFFDIGVTFNKLFFRLRKHNRTQLYYLPMEEDDFPEIDLWDPEIDWAMCPADFFDGIKQALNDAFNTDFTFNEHEKLIYVSKKYVFRKKNNAFLRYKLRSPFPFEMTLPMEGISKILSKIKDLRPIRAAIYNLPNSSGVAFDLGDIRIWFSQTSCYQDDDPIDDETLENIKENSPEQYEDYQRAVMKDWVYSGQWAFNWERDLSNLNTLIETPTSFLVKLPHDVRKYLRIFENSAGTPDPIVHLEIVALKKDMGRMNLYLEEKDYRLKDAIPVTIYGPLKSASFIMDLMNFYNIAKEGGFIGHIDLKSNDGSDEGHMYLKAKNCEYLFSVFEYKQIMR
jgi:hypothetical protein